LQEAYRGLLMTGRYAVAFLFLEMPTDQVDVNVHPTKSEVRFRNAQTLHHLVYTSVRARLRQANLTARLQAPAPVSRPLPPPPPASAARPPPPPPRTRPCPSPRPGPSWSRRSASRLHSHRRDARATRVSRQPQPRPRRRPLSRLFRPRRRRWGITSRPASCNC